MHLKIDSHDPAFVRSRHAAAQADFCDFERGGRRMGLNCGQYSMIDLIRAALELTGPADVVVATWSSGIRDGESRREWKAIDLGDGPDTQPDRPSGLSQWVD